MKQDFIPRRLPQLVDVSASLTPSSGDDFTYNGATWNGRQNNLGAIANPGATDDANAGYTIGSRWTTTGGKVWTCTDDTVGAAVWKDLTGTLTVPGAGSELLHRDSGDGSLAALSGSSVSGSDLALGGDLTVSGQLHAKATDTTTPALIAQRAESHTGNIAEIRDDLGAAMHFVKADGQYIVRADASPQLKVYGFGNTSSWQGNITVGQGGTKGSAFRRTAAGKTYIDSGEDAADAAIILRTRTGVSAVVGLVNGADGQVGVGTESPDSNSKFHLHESTNGGTAHLLLSSSGWGRNDQKILWSNDDAGSGIVSTKLRITNKNEGAEVTPFTLWKDRVGLHNTNPQHPVDITGNVNLVGNLLLSAQKGVRITTTHAPFSLHAAEPTFNTVVDPVLYVAYNLTPGTTTTPIDDTEPMLKWGLEARYNDGAAEWMEYNLDYVSADGLTETRFAAFAVNRGTHAGTWAFTKLDEFSLGSDLIKLQDKSTAQYGRISPADGVRIRDFTLNRRTAASGDNPFPALRPTSTDQACFLSLIPNGSPGFAIAGLTIYGTDYAADQTDWEKLEMQTDGSSYQFLASAGGTGVVRPIDFQSGLINLDGANSKVTLGSGALRILSNGHAGFGRDPADGVDVHDRNFILTRSTVSTPFSAFSSTPNMHGKLAANSGANGGLNITALTDAGDVGLRVLAYIGSTTLTNPAVIFDTNKLSGVDALQALAAGETAYDLRNRGTSLLKILGDGSATISGNLTVQGAFSVTGTRNAVEFGTILINATGDFTVTGLPFAPSRVKFSAAVPLDATDAAKRPTLNSDEEDNFGGVMIGYAADTGGGTVQQAMSSGGSGNSINAIRVFGSSTHCIGVSFGNQDGLSAGNIRATLSSWNADGFTVNVGTYSGITTISGLLVMYEAYE